MSTIRGDCQPVPVPGACTESRCARTLRVRPITPASATNFRPLPGSDKDLSCLDPSPAESPIAEVTSTCEGEYLVNLPPGRYSLFLAVGDCEYCAESSDRELCPVDVSPGEYPVRPVVLDLALW